MGDDSPSSRDTLAAEPELHLELLLTVLYKKNYLTDDKRTRKSVEVDLTLRLRHLAYVIFKFLILFSRFFAVIAFLTLSCFFGR